MTDFRSKAEEFVTAFLDYIQEHDIKDHFNTRDQKMERSPGVNKLVTHAESVFPKRADDGKAETDKLTEAQVSEAIEAAPNVLDTREMFARRVAKNGGTHKLLRELYEGQPGALEAVKDFLEAEDGEKEFGVPPKV